MNTESATAVLDRYAQTDDQRSIGEQLAAVEPMVRGICRSRLGPADGDDAAQRTLVTLWRRIEEGHPIQSLPKFAAGCARYEVLSTVGHAGRHPRTDPIGEGAERTWADTTPGPAERARREAEITRAEAAVERLLATLPPREAAVLRATKLGCADSSTAAAELGMSPSSIRGITSRAMARLRALHGTDAGGAVDARAVTRLRALGMVDAPHPERAAFAADFRRQRLERGLTQTQLAAAMGCDSSYLSKVELGKAWPSRDFVRRVDEAMDTGETVQRCHDRHTTPTAASSDSAEQPAAQTTVDGADATPALDATPAIAASAATSAPADGSEHLPCCVPDLGTNRAAVPEDRLDQTGYREAVEDTTAVPDAVAYEDTAHLGSAVAACAVARAAVAAAVARDVERGVVEEQARAAQLAQWHEDDRALDDEPADDATAALDDGDGWEVSC